MFIHDALSELFVCGETDILAANIKSNINRMKECSTGEPVTGFQKQFSGDNGVCVLFSLSHDDKVYEVAMTAASELCYSYLLLI